MARRAASLIAGPRNAFAARFTVAARRIRKLGPVHLLRVVDWDPGGGHAVENAPGMRKYRVAYETEPRD
ncbi:MAG: hypothetical protein QOC62_4801 [Mycobacterium sp.]|jgi:hypothetical protein|nr:hypothetical protein [Mycobacterium sp.]